VLTLYRRHSGDCLNAGQPYLKKDGKPGCPMWVRGVLNNKPVKESLKTRSWERAQQIIDSWESQGKPPEIAVDEAFAKFIADCESRNLNPSTLRKYCDLTKNLQRHFDSRGVTCLSAISPDTLRDFRIARKLSPRTAAKELERVRCFFRHCVENDWIAKNPAKHIKAPLIKPKPTLPFSEKEVASIVANTDTRSATFFRTLLHSGLRIIDAAMLRPERIENGKLFLYQQKTGVPVKVPLPPDLLKELEALPLTGGYYFVVESDHAISVAEYYRQKLKKAAKKAGVLNAHPHRFRDTFSVRLLEAGVPIEEVSVLLGHTEIKTTLMHYAPWVKSRQDRLESLVAQTWAMPKLVRVK
jgi:integrase